VIDGRAWCTATLRRVRAWTRRGERTRIAFDIDNTLVDTRARTLAIARRFDARRGTRHFERLTLAGVGLDAVETCRALGLGAGPTAEFDEVWRREFWESRNFRHDQPLARTIALARRASDAGADVVYLTGRIEALAEASRRQLRALGLPGADAAHVVCKPSLAVRTAPFKAARLGGWLEDGWRVGFFFTEGRSDVSHVQATLPQLDCVLLDCSLGGTARVRPGTPLWPRLF